MMSAGQSIGGGGDVDSGGDGGVDSGDGPTTPFNVNSALLIVFDLWQWSYNTV